MAVRASRLAQEYSGMDPRVARDILASPSARVALDAGTISDLVSWQDVGYWPDQDRVVWDIFESGNHQISGIASTAGIVPNEVRKSLDRLQQAGYISYIQEDTEISSE